MRTSKAPSPWDSRQEFLYFYFLKLKFADFETYAKRKSTKVYEYFARLVNTKDRDQVRSHHQKLMKKHKSVEKYLDFYLSCNQNQIEEMQKQYLTNKIRKVSRLHQERQNFKQSQMDSRSTIQGFDIEPPYFDTMSECKSTPTDLEEVSIEENPFQNKEIIDLEGLDLDPKMVHSTFFL